MKNKCYANFGRGCLFVFMDRVSRPITVADPGEGPGGPPPLSFGPKWGPKGAKLFSRPPPPPYLRAWMTSLPLSQGLDPALNKLVIMRDNCTKLPAGEIGIYSENSFYFSLRTCESRHIILSLWRLGGDLIHFFTDFYNFSFCYLFFTSPVYHYTRFWNLRWELGVKLVMCSLDSLSWRIVSRN